MFNLVLLVFAQGLIQSTAAQCIGAYNGLHIAGYGWTGVVVPCAAPIIETVAAPCETIAPIVAPCETIAPIGWGVPFGNGYGPAALAASNGGGLIVTSASPIAPTGVSMTSENIYEGSITVTGRIPFLGSAVLEGALPTIGGGEVAYSCGNGNVAVVSEGIPSAFGSLEVYPGALAYNCPGSYRFPGPCNGFGYARFGCGYNGIF